MGFTILIFFGPLILGIMLLEFLMIWLKSALNVVVAIMLAVNAVFFSHSSFFASDGRPQAGWSRGLSTIMRAGGAMDFWV